MANRSSDIFDGTPNGTSNDAFNGAMDPDDFAQLASRYLDGETTDHEGFALNRALEASADCRTLFVDMARLHTLLTERAGMRAAERLGEEDMPDPNGVDGRSVLHETSVMPAIRDWDTSGDLNQPVDMPDLVPTPIPIRSRGRRNWMAIAVAASGLAAVLVIGVILLGRGPSVPTVAKQTPGRDGTNSAETKAVPILAEALSANWEPAPVSGQPPVAPRTSDALPSGALSLKSGWIRIDFPSGTSAIVEGPAKFEVRDDKQLVLTSGRVSVAVTPAGHGFAVVAPFCRVVDLGTEFGVQVDAAGSNLVSVFKGTVQVARGSQPVVSMTEGNGCVVESADAPLIPIPVNPATFVRKTQFNRWAAISHDPTAVLPADRWRAYLEQISRDPSVKLMFATDAQPSDGLILKNRALSTSGQFDLATAANDPDWVQGRLAGLGALDFHNARAQRLLLPRFPASTTGSMTLAVWAYARTAVPYGGIAKNWGASRYGAFHLGLSGGRKPMLGVSLDGTKAGGPQVDDDAAAFPLGRWVLLAFTTDGKTAVLYRDGVAVGSAPSRPLPAKPGVPWLAIGYKAGDDGITPCTGPPGGVLGRNDRRSPPL